MACVMGTCGGQIADGGNVGGGSDAARLDGRGSNSPGDAGSGLAVRINIAGSAYQGIDYPGLWEADPGAGGICDGTEFDSPTTTVNGTADSPLFINQMFNSTLTCTVPNIPSGTYVVTLLFAELRLGGSPCMEAAGMDRVFDIQIGSTTVATNFDMTETGGGCAGSGGTGHAFSESYTVDVTGGSLAIVETASMGMAALNAVEAVAQ
jgi:hypothetical protein